jgi:hypothetical protein
VATIIVPPPTVTSAAPAQVCTAQGVVPVVITGTGFLTVDGAVAIASFTDPMKNAVMGTGGVASNCMPVAGTREAVQTCQTLTVNVPMGSIAVGVKYVVTVANPAPAGCVSVPDPMAPVTIVGTAPPTIASVSPGQICAGGGTLTITGTGFEMGASVTVGGVKSQAVNVMSPTTATAVVGGGLSPGSYPLVLTNPDGCSATSNAQVVVVQGLTVFFADPATVWNGISTQITVYGANVVGGIQKIGISPSGSGQMPTMLQITSSSGNRAQVIVPANTPAGTYDVFAQDAACGAYLVAGLKVVGKTSFAITSVTPNVGSTQNVTSVTIRSKGGFLATPRAFLSTGNAAARQLSSVAFVDTSTLTADVPAGTPVGTYDLIVINPDGTVAVLQAGYREIQNLTPVITALDPPVVASGQAFTVVGQNFANNAALTGACFNVDGTSAGPAQFNASAPAPCGASQCITVGGVYPGNYCIVTVTNPADMASFDFSALVLQTPALKTGPWQPATSMTTARRAFGQATVQATPSARFLYAAGGDNGAEKGALASVEAASVDINGKLGAWFGLPNALSSHRTFASLVAVDRWLYAVGGSDGTQALASIERAYVLSPADAPAFTDLNLDLPQQGQKGVPAGIFYYRVSALMANNDPKNPGGENLPSDPQVLQAPNLMNGCYITLTWSAVPGAAGYRVYRSPTADLSSGSEVLIADNVGATQYQDRFAAPLMVNGKVVKPLPLGATGLFTAIGTPLKTARSGAAVAGVVDPANAAVHYVYALGGNSGTEAMPNALQSTEWFSVTTANDGSQSVTAPAAGTNLTTARWQAAPMSEVIGGIGYVWAAGGLPGPAASVDGAAIGNGGVPGNFVGTGGMPGARAGLIAVAATNELVLFGGSGAAPSADGVHGVLNAPPPTVKNFNNLPNALGTARYLAGSAVQSSFLFACGGITVAGMPPTNTCETTIF